MLAWLSENSATIIVCVVLIAVVAAIIFSMVRNRKRENPPAHAAVQTAR